VATEPDPLLSMLMTFADHYGRAPTPEEVHAMADFRQAGGIGRLCAALTKATDNYIGRKAVKPRAA